MNISIAIAKEIIIETIKIIIFLISFFLIFYVLRLDNMLFPSFIHCKYKNLKKKLKNKTTRFDPIESVKDDKINRKHDVEKVTNFIQQNDKGHILITGSWGSGKTSLINLITEELQQKSATGYEFLKFSIWNFSDFNSILKVVIVDIAKKFNFRSWPILLNELKIKLNIFSLGLSVIPDLIDKKFSSEDKIEYFKLFVTNKLTKKNKKLVLIFDDIDRILDKEIVINVFKLIALVLDINRVFTISAVDVNNIKTIFDKIDFEKYLDKITNLKITLLPYNFSTDIVKLTMNKKNQIEELEKFREKFRKLDISKDEFHLIEELINYEVLNDLSSDIFKIWSFRELYIFDELVSSVINLNHIKMNIFLTDIVVIKYLERYFQSVLEEYLKNYIYFVSYEDYSN